MTFIAVTFIPIKAQAATQSSYTIDGYSVITKSGYTMKAQKNGLVVRDGADDKSQALATIAQGSTYSVEENTKGGWVKIDIGDKTGYVKLSEGAMVYETVSSSADKEMQLRQNIINYALSFVGNKYLYGGTDPNTGADCSGFTSYVMRKVAGITLSHSSRAQAGEGKVVSSADMKPGDLVFYAEGSGIDHVAIYMGDGKIVHASSAKTGIKVSQMDHRTPVKVVRVISL